MRLDLSNELVFGKGIPPRILRSLRKAKRPAHDLGVTEEEEKLLQCLQLPDVT